MRSSLKPVELHLLLALAAEPAHGYALVKRIEEDSAGRLRLLPGNLYGILHRLVERGLVRGSRRGPAPGEDQRRQYYEITASGRRALAQEKKRLQELVGRLRSRLAETG
jgi:DNA-binding PadR family transcriptional regulator